MFYSKISVLVDVAPVVLVLVDIAVFIDILPIVLADVTLVFLVDFVVTFP